MTVYDRLREETAFRPLVYPKDVVIKSLFVRKFKLSIIFGLVNLTDEYARKRIGIYENWSIIDDKTL